MSRIFFRGRAPQPTTVLPLPFQMLDVMHACAENSAEAHADAGPRSGPVGGNEVGVQEPASALLWRGNTEWGPGGGEGGLVQAYNHVMRVCGKAGGAELTLTIVDEMHHRWALLYSLVVGIH